MTALVRAIEQAHGKSRWIKTTAVHLDVCAHGMAFSSKGQRHALKGFSAIVSTTEQAVSLRAFTDSYTYDADAARLRAHGNRLARGRRRLRWTRDDAFAFAAIALWTYVHLPFMAGRPDVTAEVLTPSPGPDGMARLRLRLPPTVVTHSSTQVVHVDTAGRIRRHDYTAQAFGRWARAAQRLDAFVKFDGLMIATQRHVTPRLVRSAARVPELVRINILDAEPR